MKSGLSAVLLSVLGLAVVAGCTGTTEVVEVVVTPTAQPATAEPLNDENGSFAERIAHVVVIAGFKHDLSDLEYYLEAVVEDPDDGTAQMSALVHSVDVAADCGAAVEIEEIAPYAAQFCTDVEDAVAFVKEEQYTRALREVREAGEAVDDVILEIAMPLRPQ